MGERRKEGSFLTYICGFGTAPINKISRVMSNEPWSNQQLMSPGQTAEVQYN